MTYPSIEKLETQIQGFEKWTSQRLEEMKKMAAELRKQTPRKPTTFVEAVNDYTTYDGTKPYIARVVTTAPDNVIVQRTGVWGFISTEVFELAREYGYRVDYVEASGSKPFMHFLKECGC